MSEQRHAASQVKAIAEHVEQRFRSGRRVLSFAEFLELFDSQPVRYSRDSSRYLRDVFDHYGTTKVKYPWGDATRYKLFDIPWEPPPATPLPEGALPRSALIGQEHVQEEIYRALSNFVREGRPNRLVLLHGPNGSAKSTIAQCMMAALEHYSTLDDGALYRFHWVFPTQKTIRGSLGFGHDKTGGGKGVESYAHLPDEEIDAKLMVEVRDHPLFLVPTADRDQLLLGLVGVLLASVAVRGLGQLHQLAALLGRHRGEAILVTQPLDLGLTLIAREPRGLLDELLDDAVALALAAVVFGT